MTDAFSKGKRGAVVRPDSGKVRITIRLDPEIIEHFKNIVLDAGGGNYQTLINDVLVEHVRGSGQSLEKKLRRIIREELKKAS
jgi:uncharacterized protein (DUF4415 family)